MWSWFRLLLCLQCLQIGFACKYNIDCSLNGICNGFHGTCECFSPWFGTACEQLRRGRTQVPGGGVYGFMPNVTSWGGNTIFDPETKMWHLYVAEMAGRDCGLHVWGKQSTVVHASAPTIDGPYTKQDTVIESESHNPQAIVWNGSWYIFHIGTGDSHRTPQNCNKTDKTDREISLSASSATLSTRSSGSTLHRASHPEGPFEPVDGAPHDCNNPSPLLHPNGTLFLMCTWSLRASHSGSPQVCMGMERSERCEREQ